MNSNQNSKLSEIEGVRSVNNWLWMRLLHIALEADPQRTKEVLKQIKQNDQRISRLMGELVDE